ncbi:MMPL family transporter [Mobiluncus sp.]|uniref:MMPL family transporter n=1 Tax=Mobiluncus sp. TaxID=47293 RepID=UPI002A920B0F|nr:MMPL family transporter [Mobiluncus sp.]MDY6076975.1 MMPL family transporter [Mobiluncus sp.]
MTVETDTLPGEARHLSKKESFVNRAMGFLASRKAIPLRLLLLCLWLAALAFGGMAQGKIGTVSQNDQAVFLPKTAESTLATNAAKEFNDSALIPALIVATTTDESELTEAQMTWLRDLAGSLPDVQIPGDKKFSELMDGDGAFVPAIPNEANDSVLMPMNLDADALNDLDANGKKRMNSAVNALRDAITEADPGAQGLEVLVSGPTGLAADLGGAFTGIDLTLLLVALGLVFVILVVVYRSILLPVAVLGTAMSALCAAVFIVYHLAKNGILSLNGQTQGILAILVIGATTDYCLLLIARYREEMMVKAHPIDAMAAALKGSWEPIVASGGTVMAGLLTLMLSDLSSTASLGPIAALGIFFAVAAALSLLPGILMLPGTHAKILFWPAKLKHYDTEAEAIEKSHGAWAKVADFVARHDRPVWIGTLAVLGVCAAFFFTFNAEGTSTTDQFTNAPEAVTGFALINEKFDAGSSQPTTLIMKESVAEAVKADVEALEGVESTEFVTDEPASPQGMSAGVGGDTAAADQQGAPVGPPLGVDTTSGEIPPEIAAQLAAQGQMPATMPTEPTQEPEPKTIDGRVMLNITTTMPNEDKAAAAVVASIRDIAHKADAESLVGGPAAQTLDTQTTATNDFHKIFPAVMAVIVVLLILLLRALVAPLLVLFVNVVSFGAAMGISSIIFFKILGHPGADASIPIYAFVFLVALGVDYTIFLLSRAREESIKHGTREGTKRAAALTGGVITSAGIVLASTFAALVVVPLLFMFQLAVIVALGILIDTFIVRSLTIVGLTHDIGRPIWLPWTAKKVPADTK